MRKSSMERYVYKIGSREGKTQLVRIVPYSVGSNRQGSGRPHGREAEREAVFLARRTNCPNNVIAKSKLSSYFVMHLFPFKSPELS